MAAITSLSAGGYPKSLGPFAGKTPGGTAAKTALGAGGYPRMAYGSFAGKQPALSGLPHSQPFINASVGQMWGR